MLTRNSITLDVKSDDAYFQPRREEENILLKRGCCFDRTEFDQRALGITKGRLDVSFIDRSSSSIRSFALIIPSSQPVHHPV